MSTFSTPRHRYIARFAGSPSVPNGIWKAKTTHGRYHVMMLCENTAQLMLPGPPPHSTKQCSYVSWNCGGGTEGCVAFQAASCASPSLPPHWFMFTACTSSGHAARRRRVERTAALVQIRIRPLRGENLRCTHLRDQLTTGNAWCMHGA